MCCLWADFGMFCAGVCVAESEMRVFLCHVRERVMWGHGSKGGGQDLTPTLFALRFRAKERGPDLILRARAACPD